MSKRRFAWSGTSLATTLRFFEITQLGAIGTIQPVSGQRVSKQYKYALARFPWLSCSIPSAVISRSTASATSRCTRSISARFSGDAPMMLSAPQVSMQAMGLRSDA
jgi:hypothetical protein